MPTFEDYQKDTLAPGWLKDPWGEAFLSGFGKRKDAAVGVLKEAVKARMPGIAPADALAALAAERGIPRGRTETEAHHRDRVRTAWDAWRWAGTPYGLLLAFYWAGYRPTSGRVVLQVQKGWQYELRSDFDPALHAPEDALTITNIGTVHLGGSPELWSQFACLFVAPVVPAWVPTPPADGSDEVNAIRDLIVRWKPGHARCVSLQCTPVDLWDFPTETWDPTTEVWDEVGTPTVWTPPAA